MITSSYLRSRPATAAGRIPIASRSRTAGPGLFDRGMPVTDGLRAGHLPQVAGHVRRLADTDDDLPVGKLFFELAADLGHVAGDDYLSVLYLLFNSALLDEGGDGVGHEFARSPRGKHGLTFGIHNQQPRRHLAGFDLSRDREVGQREVRGQQDRAVLGRLV